MENLKILTYHYIKDSEKKIQESILGPTKENFYKQIKFLKENFNIISPEDISKAQKGDVLLTFDDGLKDHIDTVLPILLEFKLKALFFIPVCLLDHNPCPPVIIHYSLALLRLKKSEKLLKEFLKKFGIIKKFNQNTDIKEKIKEIKNFFKVELDHNIAIEISKLLNDYLNKKFPHLFEKIFLSKNDLKTISKNNQFIACHTYSHPSFSKKFSINFLKHEIILAKKRLEEFIGKKNNFFCLPYGTAEDCKNLNYKIFIDSDTKYLFKCFPASIEKKESLVIFGRKSVYMTENNHDISKYLEDL